MSKKHSLTIKRNVAPGYYLTKMSRFMISELDLTPDEVAGMLRESLNRRDPGLNKSKINTKVRNLHAAISVPAVSWKNFVAFLTAMPYLNVKITITGTKPDGSKDTFNFDCDMRDEVGLDFIKGAKK